MTLGEELRARRRSDDGSAAMGLDREALLSRCRRRLAASLAAWGAAILVVGALGSVAVEAAINGPTEPSTLVVEAVPPEVAPGEAGAVRLWLEAEGGSCSASADHAVTVVLSADPPVLRLARGTVRLARCGEEHAAEVDYTVAQTEPVEVVVMATASGGDRRARVDTTETVTVVVRPPPTNRVMLDTPQRDLLFGEETVLTVWLAPGDDGTCYATTTDAVDVALSTEPTGALDLDPERVALEGCGRDAAEDITVTAPDLDDETQVEVEVGATASGGAGEAQFEPAEPVTIAVRAPEANRIVLDAFPTELEVDESGTLTVWLEPGEERTCNATDDHPVEVQVTADPALLELAPDAVTLEGCGRTHAQTVDYTAGDIGADQEVDVTVGAEPTGGVPGAQFDDVDPETVTIVRVVRPNRLQVLPRPAEVEEGGEGSLVVWLATGATEECYATADNPVTVTVTARPDLLRMDPNEVTLTGCGRDQEATLDYVAGGTGGAQRIDVEVTAEAPDAEPDAPIDPGGPVTVVVRAAPEPNEVELEADPEEVSWGGQGELTVRLDRADAEACHATPDAPATFELAADPDVVDLPPDVTLEGCGSADEVVVTYAVPDPGGEQQEQTVEITAAHAEGGMSRARFEDGRTEIVVLARVD